MPQQQASSELATLAAASSQVVSRPVTSGALGQEEADRRHGASPRPPCDRRLRAEERWNTAGMGFGETEAIELGDDQRIANQLNGSGRNGEWRY